MSTAPPVPRRSVGGLLRTVGWEGFLLVLLLVTVVLGMLASDPILAATNLAAIVGNQSEKAIMILPIVLLIVAGEIDLSIASVAALAAAVMASLFQAGVPLPVGIVAALLVGAAAGLLNGSLVARLRLPSLVATLGTLALFRGLSSVILEGQAVTGFPRWFTDFGYGFVPGTLIPAPMVLVGVLAIAYAYVLHLTPIGRTIYAVGSNEEAVRFVGIPVARLKLGLFVSSGVLAAVAGVVYAARFASTRADAAVGFELDVIAAALLGGVSIFGGRGTIVGALLGLFLLGLVRGALNLMDVPVEVQLVVVGMLLVGSVLVANAAGQVRDRVLR